MNTITDPSELIPGKWYCIGHEDLEGQMQWGEILLFEGGIGPNCEGGHWTDDDGTRRHLFDPVLQMPVTTADAYAPQF